MMRCIGFKPLSSKWKSSIKRRGGQAQDLGELYLTQANISVNMDTQFRTRHPLPVYPLLKKGRLLWLFRNLSSSLLSLLVSLAQAFRIDSPYHDSSTKDYSLQDLACCYAKPQCLSSILMSPDGIFQFSCQFRLPSISSYQQWYLLWIHMILQDRGAK